MPPLVLGGGAHLLAREGVGESQFRRVTYTMVLFTYIYFLFSNQTDKGDETEGLENEGLYMER